MTATISQDTPSPVREGEVLDGKYQVERVLGIGGMGVVVAAKHLQLDQRVAIKFVLPHAVQNADAMQRFAREARAAVKLRSLHVARVIDVGTLSTGSPYMVMEYLEGRDLGELVTHAGALGHVQATDLILQACEAIAEAHALGIVHRDLKPANLFVTHGVDGQPLVKVLDFGISKQTSLSNSASELSLTRTSMVMGSPNYMSPEQLRSSKSVDARSDIWALGVILFEVLTTRVPFEAETVTQLTAMVLQDTPRRVDELRADVPAGLARVIARCLEKDPAARYETVAALARDLEPFGSKNGVALRIAQVTATGPYKAIPESIASGRVSVSGGTSVAWGDTQLAGPPKRRAVYAVGGVLAVLVLVGVGTAIGAHNAASSAAAVSTPPLEVTPTVRQIDLAGPAPTPPPAPAPPPPAPVASAAVPPAASAGLVADRAPLASATPAAATSPPSTHKSSASPPSQSAKQKQSKHGSDDLPDERN